LISEKKDGQAVSMAKVYALLWILWIAAFLAIELSAIFTAHDQYTLSDFVWRLEHINAAWTFLRFFICAFCVWLTLHMSLGWFR
jgi:hypothetical protein